MSGSEDVKRYYDARPEEEWDRLGANLHGRIKHRIHLSVLERHLPEDALVLDVGCGPGRFAIDVIRRGCRVVLADLSGSQLDLAVEKIREAGLIDAVEGTHRLDVTDLSAFEDGTFDATLCFGGALSYAREGAPRAAAELRRVTRPGGPVMVSVMGVWGALRFGVVLDPPDVFERLEDHLEWDGSSELPEVFPTRIGSTEFHAPMTLYTARSLADLLEEAGLTVVDVAAANPLSVRGQLPRTEKNARAAERMIAFEVQASRRPELLDAGEHIIAVAR
jgi:SAM-dependent methyltransferase